MEYRVPDAMPDPGVAEWAVWLFRGLLPARCSGSSNCTVGRTAAGKMLLAALLCLCITPAKAGAQPPVGWACWISEQVPINIKCIRDRSYLRQATPDDPESALMRLRPPSDDQGDSPQSVPDDMDDLDDNPSQPRQTAPGVQESELEAAVLDQIYGKILAGETAGLDDVLEKHHDDLRQGSVWVLDIHTYPMDSSWRENRPARIVKSALCQRNPSCTVILHETGQ